MIFNSVSFIVFGLFFFALFFIIYAIYAVRKNSMKTAVLVGMSGVMMVLLSLFKKDVPDNHKKTELAERTKKGFDKL